GGVDGALVRLRQAGTVTIPVHPYRCQLPSDPFHAHRLVDDTIGGRVDAVTFTSAAAVHGLLAVAGRRWPAVVAAFNDRVLAACIGDVCAGAAREAGVVQPVRPDHPRLGALVQAVADHLL